MPELTNRKTNEDDDDDDDNTRTDNDNSNSNSNNNMNINHRNNNSPVLLTLEGACESLRSNIDKNLIKLDFSSNTGGGGGGTSSSSSHNTIVTIGDAGAVALAFALKKNTVLKELHLGKTGIGISGITSLAACFRTSNRTLERLYLQDNPLIGDKGTEAIATIFKQQQHQSPTSASASVSTSASESNTTVPSTNKALSFTTSTSIKLLNLARCNVGDVGVCALQDVLILEPLLPPPTATTATTATSSSTTSTDGSSNSDDQTTTTSTTNNTNTDNNSKKQLTQHSLEKLYIYGNNITNIGASAIGEIIMSPYIQLQELFLWDNPNITDDGIEDMDHAYQFQYGTGNNTNNKIKLQLKIHWNSTGFSSKNNSSNNKKNNKANEASTSSSSNVVRRPRVAMKQAEFLTNSNSNNQQQHRTPTNSPPPPLNRGKIDTIDFMMTQSPTKRAVADSIFLNPTPKTNTKNTVSTVKMNVGTTTAAPTPRTRLDTSPVRRVVADSIFLNPTPTTIQKKKIGSVTATSTISTPKRAIITTGANSSEFEKLRQKLASPTVYTTGMSTTTANIVGGKQKNTITTNKTKGTILDNNTTSTSIEATYRRNPLVTTPRRISTNTSNMKDGGGTSGSAGISRWDQIRQKMITDTKPLPFQHSSLSQRNLIVDGGAIKKPTTTSSSSSITTAATATSKIGGGRRFQQEQLSQQLPSSLQLSRATSERNFKVSTNMIADSSGKNTKKKKRLEVSKLDSKVSQHVLADDERQKLEQELYQGTNQLGQDSDKVITSKNVIQTTTLTTSAATTMPLATISATNNKIENAAANVLQNFDDDESKTMVVDSLVEVGRGFNEDQGKEIEQSDDNVDEDNEQSLSLPPLNDINTTLDTTKETDPIISYSKPARRNKAKKGGTTKNAAEGVSSTLKTTSTTTTTSTAKRSKRTSGANSPVRNTTGSKNDNVAKNSMQQLSASSEDTLSDDATNNTIQSAPSDEEHGLRSLKKNTVVPSSSSNTTNTFLVPGNAVSHDETTNKPKKVMKKKLQSKSQSSRNLAGNEPKVTSSQPPKKNPKKDGTKILLQKSYSCKTILVDNNLSDKSTQQRKDTHQHNATDTVCIDGDASKPTGRPQFFSSNSVRNLKDKYESNSTRNLMSKDVSVNNNLVVKQNKALAKDNTLDDCETTDRAAQVDGKASVSSSVSVRNMRDAFQKSVSTASIVSERTSPKLNTVPTEKIENAFGRKVSSQKVATDLSDTLKLDNSKFQQNLQRSSINTQDLDTSEPPRRKSFRVQQVRSMFEDMDTSERQRRQSFQTSTRKTELPGAKDEDRDIIALLGGSCSNLQLFTGGKEASTFQLYKTNPHDLGTSEQPIGKSFQVNQMKSMFEGNKETSEDKIRQNFPKGSNKSRQLSADDDDSDDDRDFIALLGGSCSNLQHLADRGGKDASRFHMFETNSNDLGSSEQPRRKSFQVNQMRSRFERKNISDTKRHQRSEGATSKSHQPKAKLDDSEDDDNVDLQFLDLLGGSCSNLEYLVDRDGMNESKYRKNISKFDDLSVSEQPRRKSLQVRQIRTIFEDKEISEKEKQHSVKPINMTFGQRGGKYDDSDDDNQDDLLELLGGSCSNLQYLASREAKDSSRTRTLVKDEDELSTSDQPRRRSLQIQQIRAKFEDMDTSDNLRLPSVDAQSSEARQNDDNEHGNQDALLGFFNDSGKNLQFLDSGSDRQVKDASKVRQYKTRPEDGSTTEQSQPSKRFVQAASNTVRQSGSNNDDSESFVMTDDSNNSAFEQLLYQAGGNKDTPIAELKSPLRRTKKIGTLMAVLEKKNKTVEDIIEQAPINVESSLNSTDSSAGKPIENSSALKVDMTSRDVTSPGTNKKSKIAKTKFLDTLIGVMDDSESSRDSSKRGQKQSSRRKVGDSSMDQLKAAAIELSERSGTSNSIESRVGFRVQVKKVTKATTDGENQSSPHSLSETISESKGSDDDKQRVQGEETSSGLPKEPYPIHSEQTETNSDVSAISSSMVVKKVKSQKDSQIIPQENKCTLKIINDSADSIAAKRILEHPYDSVSSEAGTSNEQRNLGIADTDRKQVFAQLRAKAESLTKSYATQQELISISSSKRTDILAQLKARSKAPVKVTVPELSQTSFSPITLVASNTGAMSNNSSFDQNSLSSEKGMESMSEVTNEDNDTPKVISRKDDKMIAIEQQKTPDVVVALEQDRKDMFAQLKAKAEANSKSYSGKRELISNSAEYRKDILKQLKAKTKSSDKSGVSTLSPDPDPDKSSHYNAAAAGAELNFAAKVGSTDVIGKFKSQTESVSSQGTTRNSEASGIVSLDIQKKSDDIVDSDQNRKNIFAQLKAKAEARSKSYSPTRERISISLEDRKATTKHLKSKPALQTSFQDPQEIILDAEKNGVEGGSRELEPSLSIEDEEKVGIVQSKVRDKIASFSSPIKNSPTKKPHIQISVESRNTISTNWIKEKSKLFDSGYIVQESPRGPMNGESSRYSLLKAKKREIEARNSIVGPGDTLVMKSSSFGDDIEGRSLSSSAVTNLWRRGRRPNSTVKNELIAAEQLEKQSVVVDPISTPQLNSKSEICGIPKSNSSDNAISERQEGADQSRRNTLRMKVHALELKAKLHSPRKEMFR